MKRLRLLSAVSICTTMFVASAYSFDGTIRIGGSTTLLPVVADSASRFMEKYKTWDKVSPTLPKVPVVIFVTGGGSGFGIKAAIDGTVQIGMSSRDINEKERAQLSKHKEVLVSKDCLAFAVNKKNPLAKLNNLSQKDVVRIFSGEAAYFSDIDRTLPKKPILVQMRDAAGGSTEMLQKEILKDKTFTQKAIQVPSQGANIKKLETNASTIGYASSVVASQNPKIKILKYEGVDPSNENVISGKYKLTRPLLFLVKEPAEPEIQAFVDYMLGEGQKIVIEHGYVPVKKVK